MISTSGQGKVVRILKVLYIYIQRPVCFEIIVIIENEGITIAVENATNLPGNQIMCFKEVVLCENLVSVVAPQGKRNCRSAS